MRGSVARSDHSSNAPLYPARGTEDRKAATPSGDDSSVAAAVTQAEAEGGGQEVTAPPKKVLTPLEAAMLAYKQERRQVAKVSCGLLPVPHSAFVERAGVLVAGSGSMAGYL